MKHSPAPWRINQRTIYSGCDIYAEDGYVCTTSGNAVENAKLIAAAPELLAALESLRGIEAWIPDRKLKEHFQNTVYAAIEKAYGKSIKQP